MNKIVLVLFSVAWFASCRQPEKPKAIIAVAGVPDTKRRFAANQIFPADSKQQG